MAASSGPNHANNKRPATNGVSENGDTDPSASPEPAKKKVKRSASSEDADARLAAQLQAQENSLARSRSTRGGGDRAKVTKKRKAPKKKSAKKVGGDDDSEVDGSADSGVPKRKAGGGFQKPFTLSPMLSELCGETQVGCALGGLVQAADRDRLCSSLGHRSSRSYGSTSRQTTCRTPRTSGKFAATTRCRPCSSRPRWTCFA